MERIFDVLRITTGLNLNDSHKMSIVSYVRRRLEILDMDLEEYIGYFPSNEIELSLLVDEAAINETYFFREEQQFDFLSSHAFSSLMKDRKSISIWSAACSSGEEPISLLALTHHLGIDAQIFASDIDTQALTTFRKGTYYKNSLRPDGMKYHSLLKGIGTLSEKEFTLSDDEKKKINFSHYNLVSNETIPFAEESLDLIFIRNVFIYFDSNTRNKVIEKMEQALRPGGILMLSVNEIAGVEAEENSLLYKEHEGRVFYFRKARNLEEKNHLSKRNMTRILVDEKNSNENQKKDFDFNRDYRNRQTDETAHISLNSFEERITVVKNETAGRGCESRTEKILVTNENIKDKICPVLDLIFSLDITSAKKKLDSLIFRPERQEYFYFAKGLIAEKEDCIQEAKMLYEKAGILNTSIWPATFNLANLHQKTGEKKQALRTFEKCLSQIEKYIEDKQNTFDFLIESFSPEYFLELCRQNIRKLQEK